MDLKDVAPICRKVNVNAVEYFDLLNRFPKVIKNFNNLTNT